MKVVPEDVLLDLLGRCVQISQEILPLLPASGTKPASPAILKMCSDLIADLHRQKRNDSVLADESWEWIWDLKKGITHLQLYGRLAWLNYNLHGLL